MESWGNQLVRVLGTYLIVGVLCFSLVGFRVQGTQQEAHVISSTGTITSSGNLGWLHVDGRWIKDGTGRILHFVGCAEAQTSWRRDTDPYWNHEADPIPMATRMAELGVTWVRICLTYSFWSDPTAGNTYKDLIDRYVHEFTSRGVYCTVGCMGDEFGNDLTNGNPTNWLNFLSDLANRYKDNPGVCGIYIFNEWQFSVPLDKCHTYAVQASQTLHGINQNLLILVHGDLLNRQGIDSYWVSNPIPVPNVVYLYHDYFWQHYYYDKSDFALSYEVGNYALAKQQMEAYFYQYLFKYAVEKGMCIMNEESGFADGQNPDLAPGEKGYAPGSPQSIRDYFDLLNKYSIPWNYYAWLMGGYSLTDDGVNLNIVGGIWFNHLIGT